MVWALLAIYFLMVIISSYVSAKNEGYLGTILFFSLSFFIYNMSIPFEMIFTENGWARDDHGETYIETNRQYQIIISALWGYLGFCIGYLLSFRPLKKNSYDYQIVLSKNTYIPKVLMIFVISSILVSLWLGLPYIKVFGDYAAWTEVRYKLSNLAFSLELASISLAMLAFVLIHHFRLGFVLSLLAVSPNILWGLYSNDKDPILTGILVYVSITWRYWFSRSIIGFLAIWIGAASVGVIGVIAFSQFRGGGQIEIQSYLKEKGIFRRTDPAGPLLSLNDTLNKLQDEELSYYYGSSYLQGFVLWIPKKIWPNRPHDLSQTYAQEKIEHWSEGVGVGFSLLSESFMNFGWIGPFIQYLLLGIFWKFLWFSLIKRLFRDNLLFYSLYVVVGFNLLIKMHRAPFSGIITTTLHIVAPLLLIQAILFIVRKQYENYKMEQLSEGRLGT